jgi:hypothetical protein
VTRRFALPIAIPVVALGAFALLWTLWLGRRSPVDARVDATLLVVPDPHRTGGVTASGAGTTLALRSADVRVVDISESTGLDVGLPFERSVCTRLHGCHAGVLRAVPPLTLSWAKRPGPMSMSRTDVALVRTAFDAGGLGIVSVGEGPSHLCLFAPFRSDALQVTLASGASPPAVDVQHAAPSCDSGVRVSVARGRSPAGRETLFLEGVQSLDLELTAPLIDLLGRKEGTADVGGANVFGDEPVSIRGDRVTVRLTVDEGGSGATLRTSTFRATSVKDDTTELVPTNFARHQALLQWILPLSGLPLLAALVGLGAKARNKIQTKLEHGRKR